MPKIPRDVERRLRERKQVKRFSFPRLMNEAFAFKEGEYKKVPGKYLKLLHILKRNKGQTCKIYIVTSKDHVQYIIGYEGNDKAYGFNGNIENVVKILKENGFRLLR